MKFKNPFILETYRDKLAVKKEYTKLAELYNKGYPEIKDINSAKFWDEILGKTSYLKDQDGMTKDRVITAAKFVPENAKKLLDVGAGPGFVEELLIDRKIEIYGNDISPYAVKELKKRFKGHFIVEDLYKMKYKKEFYDVIVLLEVLEHIPPSKTFDVLRKIYNYLKPGGCFIISVPMNEGLESMHTNPNGHVRVYTKNLISAELEIAGFDVLKYKEFYAFSSLYKIKKLTARIIKNKWQPNNILIKAQKN